MDKAICKVCGVEFEITPQRRGRPNLYCNKACHNESMRKLVTMSCAYCGKSFELRPAKARDRKYCCHKCAVTDASQKTKRICLQCGNEFWAKCDHVRNGMGFFCSRECFYQNRRDNKIKRVCECCGKEFSVSDSQYEARATRFCSTVCYFKTNSLSATKIEIAVAKILTLLGEVYEEQKKFDRWHADFYLPQRNLIIEVDGEYWHSLPKAIDRDKRKDDWFNDNGYKIARIPESKVNEDVYSAVVEVLH